MSAVKNLIGSAAANRKRSSKPPTSSTAKDSLEVVEAVEDSKLESMFSDPTAKLFTEADKSMPSNNIEIENDGEPEDGVVDNRRKSAIERKKLANQRTAEKNADAHRTVFVGNVSLDATKKDIIKMFRGCDEKSFEDAPESLCDQDFHPLSKTCNAYVVFKDGASVRKALKLNGKVLCGRYIRVDTISAGAKPTPSKKNSVFIGNLSFDVQEDHVRRHFARCGDIVNVRIIRDKITKIGKGFGYVEFKSADGVTLALNLHGQLMGRRTLRIQRCQDSEKLKTLSNKEKKKVMAKSQQSPEVKSHGGKAKKSKK